MEKTRPRSDTPEDQMVKYSAHKKANEVLKTYMTVGNYIGAYLVAFSLFEDRIKAFYAVVMKDMKQAKPDEWMDHDFKSMIDILRPHSEKADRREILKAATQRNKLVHSAMYNLDVFTKEHVSAVVSVTDRVEKLFYQYKRKNKSTKPS